MWGLRGGEMARGRGSSLGLYLICGEQRAAAPGAPEVLGVALAAPTPEEAGRG